MSDGAQLAAPPQSPDAIRLSLRTVLMAFVALAPILWFYVTARNQSIKHEAEISQRTKAIWGTLDATVIDVESIRTKLGRPPMDAQEIENMTGHPMSIKITDKLSSPVYYEPTSSNSYNLVFSVEWLEGVSDDFLMYDSTKPKAGWVGVCN